MSYLKRYGIQSPEQYYAGSSGINDQLDSWECWNCTAGLTSANINYMRARYPDLLDQFKPMVRTVYGSVLDEMIKNWPAIMNALDGEWGNPISQ